jgi:catechol 2,3-dioxygenase-like lactoylglutathione lyase family enzyme
MFRDSPAISGFSVDDLARAREFYTSILGLEVSDQPEMGSLMNLHIGGGTKVLVYEKDDHLPATFTILNFPVPDVDAAVDALTQRGVSMLRYDSFPQDEKGILRGAGGPAIAWFTDPAGNVLAVLESS